MQCKKFDEKKTPILYKYKPIDLCGFTKKILEHGEIYFSQVCDLNDPFEYFFSFKKGGLFSLKDYEVEVLKVDQSQKVDNGKYRLTKKQKTEYYTRYIKEDESGIFCLSDHRDSIYMYTHYAEGFKGICIGFDSTIFNDNMEKFGIRLVEYKREPHRIVDESTWVDDWVAIFHTKSKKFKEEGEYRIRIANGVGTNFNRIDTLSPTSVRNAIREIIFGFNISEEDVLEILRLTKDLELKYFVAKPVIGKYKLKITEYVDYSDIKNFS